jgi:hypothetical protein
MWKCPDCEYPVGKVFVSFSYINNGDNRLNESKVCENYGANGKCRITGENCFKGGKNKLIEIKD